MSKDKENKQVEDYDRGTIEVSLCQRNSLGETTGRKKTKTVEHSKDAADFWQNNRPPRKKWKKKKSVTQAASKEEGERILEQMRKEENNINEKQ